ncbi:sporulation histidine kinase inhibitor Sda [Paenibacillus sp. Soil787]|uniref:sporulation histidine kinase inhibitor Sda n=1 Tax=Paenibacillus sp. Soil787 TaxID=1736411 RepID=UPI0007027EC3|nr:hypothetical protein ASG93_09950 [Paenibacillus sp. Soil787]
MWSLSNEELLTILNEATKLKLDTEFIEMIQYQIHQRKVEENIKKTIYYSSVELMEKISIGDCIR